MEIRKLRQENPNSKVKLDPDVLEIFGETLESISGRHGNNYTQMLDEYSRSIFAKFNTYGPWTTDHQRMLKDYIEERFNLARNAKTYYKEAGKYKELYNGAIEKYSREKANNDEIKTKFADLEKPIRDALLVIVN